VFWVVNFIFIFHLLYECEGVLVRLVLLEERLELLDAGPQFINGLGVSLFVGVLGEGLEFFLFE